MTIEKTVNGNEVTLKLRGWMDTQNAPALEQALSELGPDTGIWCLTWGNWNIPRPPESVRLSPPINR